MSVDHLFGAMLCEVDRCKHCALIFCVENTSLLCINKKIGKGSFYIVQYPVRWTALQSAFTLFAFPDRHVHSGTNSASPGSILARLQLHAKTKSLPFPPLSVARYSFIQLSQQGCQWRE